MKPERAVTVGVALAAALSLGSAARAQQSTGTTDKATNSTIPDTDAARREAAQRILALGVGLDWRKLTLADLQQIEKDLKATSEQADNVVRVIIAARLRELGIAVDWHRFTTRQLADIYVAALGAGKTTREAAPPPTDTDNGAVLVPAPDTAATPPSAGVVPAPDTEMTPSSPAPAPTAPYTPVPEYNNSSPVYENGAATLVYTPPFAYYSPTPIYGAPVYPATAGYYTRPYSCNHHGTTNVVPAPVKLWASACSSQSLYAQRPLNQVPGTVIYDTRSARVGSVVPNGNGGVMVNNSPSQLTRSMTSFTPRSAPSSTPRMSSRPAPTMGFGGFRMGGGGFRMGGGFRGRGR